MGCATLRTFSIHCGKIVSVDSAACAIPLLRRDGLGAGCGMPVADGEAMHHIPLKEFTKVGHQLRWLTWLAFWLLASYSLRLWADDALRQMAHTRR